VTPAAEAAAPEVARRLNDVFAPYWHEVDLAGAVLLEAEAFYGDESPEFRKERAQFILTLDSVRARVLKDLGLE
jgi:hypothetical protein